MTLPRVPHELLTLTPAQYGAKAPTQTDWPLNPGLVRTQYALSDLYATVQGEGQHAGTPMTIVRLSGCPVGCVFCDQPETWARPPSTAFEEAEEIVARVAALSPRWALVTGGEPCWHDLTMLSHYLRRAGLKTALETSGVYPLTGRWTWATLSPKPAGRLPLLPGIVEQVNEIKWIVGSARDVKALEVFLDQQQVDPNRTRVSVQPVSAKARATTLCLEAVLAHPEWHVSTQLHKTVWQIA